MKRYLFFLLTILATGCGGGTSGTGGTGSSEIVGKIADTEDRPISGAQVIIEESGDNAVSDANGEFDFESNILTDKVTMLVTTNGTEARALVDEIPAGPQIINVSLVVDKREKTVRIREKEIKPRPRRPRPTPTVIAIATVTAIPTAVPTLAPTIEIAVTPTARHTPGVQLFTQFVGSIVSSDPSLLIDAKIGIVGRARRVVQSDGSFFFRIKALRENNHIVVASGGRIARLQIVGIDEKTKRVRLLLRLEKKTDNSLAVSLESAEITPH